MSKETENKEEQIDLTQYVYDNTQTVEIPAKLLEGLMQTLDAVKNNETNYGYISNYPKSSKIENNENGTLENVDVEWVQYPTAVSYFSQQPQEIRTQLGVMSTDLLMVLQGLHLENIEKGVAKKVGSLKKVEI